MANPDEKGYSDPGCGKFRMLSLPPVKLRLVREEGIVKAFDKVRKKYVALTPEEYVRLHFVDWLVEYMNYPLSHIANEVSLKFNGMSRRADTLVAGRKGEPLVVIEYKNPEVEITQGVFDQIARYNSVINAKYLVVSNGINHYCCVMDCNGGYHFIPRIPDYNEVTLSQSEN